jgi:hypothetical protein
MVADTNRDNQIEPAELNQAMVEIGHSAVQAAFNAADTDRNGAVSLAEFDKALTAPAHVAFRIFDANNDGQISADELQSGIQILIREVQAMRVPDAPNSLSHQLSQPAYPAGTAPPGQPIRPAPVAAPPGQAARADVPPQR